MGFSKSQSFGQRFYIWDQVVNSIVFASMAEEAERHAFPSVDRTKNLTVDVLPRNKEIFLM